MNIYNVPGVVKTAPPRVCQPININAGFQKTGTYPLDVDIFNEQDSMPSYATNRPNPEPESTVENEVGPLLSFRKMTGKRLGVLKIQFQLFRFYFQQTVDFSSGCWIVNS